MERLRGDALSVTRRGSRLVLSTGGVISDLDGSAVDLDRMTVTTRYGEPGQTARFSADDGAAVGAGDGVAWRLVEQGNLSQCGASRLTARSVAL